MCKPVNVKKNEPCDINIMRPGPFGNPFKVGRDGKRGECVELFKKWFYSSDQNAILMRERVKREIKIGMRLGCCCKPKKCHGDVIATFVNRGYEKEILFDTSED